MQDPVDESEEEKPSKFKKIYIFIISLFLLIIFIIYFTTTPGVRDLISGFIESSKLNEKEVAINSTNKLIFEKESYDSLIELHNESVNREFKACLSGYIKDGDYHITTVIKPETFFQNYKQVIAEPCPSTSLVDLHSHPFKRCLPSEQDFKSFQEFKSRNPNALMAVLCEVDRFSFYS
jgi:proteasome lid subunit RPN8/RPN11